MAAGRFHFALRVAVDPTMTVDDFRALTRRARLGALHAGGLEADVILPPAARRRRGVR